MSEKSPSLLIHIRDWLALPFVVTVIIPFLLYKIGIQLIQMPPQIVEIGGIIVYALGISMQLYTTSLFGRYAQGTLAPWQPTQKLVIRGPYQYCRNPMITGVLMMLLGEALFFNALGIMIWTCIFFAMNTMYFIFKEEPSMLARFGEAYTEYKKQVPRWIPRVTPYKGGKI
ncbi:MAG TPA: isoprenylcysteine carboxylmethyltransferase family protein [Bacteroidia bacterium]|jgi:protein-S-isoprenylcysteine O-methyltransferase Ste14|nr:isoprenylcysteine carboxylmethyltransferase family protein [Bacteroidia bacterium]